jgi:hypothetical protein
VSSKEEKPAAAAVAVTGRAVGRTPPHGAPAVASATTTSKAVVTQVAAAASVAAVESAEEESGEEESGEGESGGEGVGGDEDEGESDEEEVKLTPDERRQQYAQRMAAAREDNSKHKATRDRRVHPGPV